MTRPRNPAHVAATLLATVVAVRFAAATPPPGAEGGPDPPAAPASDRARETLDRLLESPAWARRAIGVMRLDGRGDDASRDRLVAMLGDPAWQVRTFAVCALGRRRVPDTGGWFMQEDDPRIMRAALSHRYATDLERLARGIANLGHSRDLEDRMLGAELAVLSRDEALLERADAALRAIILRMDRREAAALAPRLAALTGRPLDRRPRVWQRWIRTVGKPLPMPGGFALPEDPSWRPEPCGIARLDDDQFVELEGYIDELAERRVDLAICLDTTASMWGEIAEAQGELDDMMRFAADVVAELRVGFVAYRDKRDRYETKGWDLTADIATARARLWGLEAGGGGDRPELVHAALRQAYAGMSWAPGHAKVLVLVGDAPPHPGFGARAAEDARTARRQLDVVTHAIEAAGRRVPHFAEIAAAGEGRCVSLEDGDSLVTEIAGLTLGDRFGEEMREFFAAYLLLCR